MSCSQEMFALARTCSERKNGTIFPAQGLPSMCDECRRSRNTLANYGWGSKKNVVLKMYEDVVEKSLL